MRNWSISSNLWIYWSWSLQRGNIMKLLENNLLWYFIMKHGVISFMYSIRTHVPNHFMTCYFDYILYLIKIVLLKIWVFLVRWSKLIVQNVESICFLWTLCMSLFFLEVPLQLDLFCMLLLVKIHFPQDLAMELCILRNFICPIQQIWPIMFIMADTKYRKCNNFVLTVYR